MRAVVEGIPLEFARLVRALLLKEEDQTVVAGGSLIGSKRIEMISKVILPSDVSAGKIQCEVSIVVVIIVVVIVDVVVDDDDVEGKTDEEFCGQV